MIEAPESIQTERLLLRKSKLEDAELIFEKYARDPEVTKFLVWAPHRSVDDTQAFLRRCESVWASGEAFPYVIERHDDNELLGVIVLRMEANSAELGFVLGKKYWGKGYMPEAARALVEWALSLDEIYRVSAFCDVENGASARVMEKAGMQREGILRRHTIHPNISPEPRDVYIYAKVK